MQGDGSVSDFGPAMFFPDASAKVNLLGVNGECLENFQVVSSWSKQRRTRFRFRLRLLNFFTSWTRVRNVFKQIRIPPNLT